MVTALHSGYSSAVSSLHASRQRISAMEIIPLPLPAVFKTPQVNPQLHCTHWLNRVKSQSYFTTGGLPPISSSWRQAPSYSRPVILFYNWTLAVIALTQHPLWREDGSIFTIVAGPRQRCHSQVRVPRYTWPHSSVSDSRLPHYGEWGPRIYIPQEQGGDEKGRPTRSLNRARAVVSYSLGADPQRTPLASPLLLLCDVTAHA
jgi:hypothetical protein